MRSAVLNTDRASVASFMKVKEFSRVFGLWMLLQDHGTRLVGQSLLGAYCLPKAVRRLQKWPRLERFAASRAILKIG
jgi:hypothetical protein